MIRLEKITFISAFWRSERARRRGIRCEDVILTLLSQADRMVPVHLGGKWLIVQVILLGGARQRLSGTGDLFRFRNFAAFGGAIRILEEPRFWPIFRRSMLRISVVGKNRRCVFAAERLPLYLFEMLRYAASFAILLSAFSGIGRGQQHAVDPGEGFHRLVCLVHLTGSGTLAD